MTVFDYIEKYKNTTFEEKKFNEIDNIILSLISYLNFSYIDCSKKLEDIGKIYLQRHKLKEVSKSGLAQRDAYMCLEMIIKSERYRNIEVSNYVYIATENEQFSAVTFKINKKLSYIAYEGTDHLMVGWKEDFELTYKYPIPAQIHAIKYLKNTVKLLGPQIIVGGHSKGGNLALISAMELNPIKKLKIKKIYSNDGPGLRLKQFKSIKYKIVKHKLIHIVPDNSIIGIMLRNDKYKVVKSKKKTIMSHIPSTWLIEDDKLIESKLSKKSEELEKSVIEWLNQHNDDERKQLIDNVFQIFENSGITDTTKFKDVSNLIKMIKEVRNIDNKTKELVINFISYNFLRKI